MLTSKRVPKRHPRVWEREETMNKKIKFLIITCMLLLVVLAITSCKQSNIYNDYDEQGYSIRIEFDANGSFFGNSNQVRVFDMYNLDELPTNEAGMKVIKIVNPEDISRGKENAYELQRKAKPGYFFAGWYTEMTAKKDENGNTYYEYNGKWDFENGVLEIDPNKEYTASKPTLTLHAAWVKIPTIEIYDGETSIGKIDITNPANTSNAVITTPYIDLAKGEYNFGIIKSLLSERIVTGEDTKVTSFYEGLYLDKELTEKLGETYTHPYEYDEQTATIKNEVLKLYVNYEEMDGEWYRIYSAKQLANNAKADGNYVLMSDITFDGLTAWPNVFRNNVFTGSIVGNGYTISNVNIESTSGQYFGMFKSISASAKIENVSFDGITAKLERAYRNPGGRYAVFAATIEDGFKFENVSFTNVDFQISDSAIVIVTADYEIGFICADGYSENLGVSLDGFTASVYVTEPASAYDLTITVNGNQVEIEFQEKLEDKE